MALAKPKPLSKPKNAISETSYVENSDDLTLLSLDQLADRFDSIEQQAQLYQGRILLEARNRFESDIAFGEWVTNAGGTLCSITRQHRTRLMNLARFFDSRELTGISITAAYEISAPINEDVADKIYEYALNKNLPVSEIKAQIQIAKGLSQKGNKTEPVTTEPVLLPLEDLDTFKQVILSDIEGLSEQNAIKVLQDCIKEVRAKKNNEQPIPASKDAGNNS